MSSSSIPDSGFSSSYHSMPGIRERFPFPRFPGDVQQEIGFLPIMFLIKDIRIRCR